MWGEKIAVLGSRSNIRNTRAMLWRRATEPHARTHTPASSNAAWQTLSLSPIGLRDRLSTLRSSRVAPPSVGVGERAGAVSRRCPLARARRAQRSKLTIINEKSRFVLLILCHRTGRCDARTIAAERCSFAHRIERSVASKDRETTDDGFAQDFMN